MLSVAVARSASDRPTALRYVVYFRFYGWRHVFIQLCQWARIKHNVMFRRSSPGNGTSWMSENLAEFCWVHQNAAVGTKSAVYDFFVSVELRVWENELGSTNWSASHWSLLFNASNYRYRDIYAKTWPPFTIVNRADRAVMNRMKINIPIPKPHYEPFIYLVIYLFYLLCIYSRRSSWSVKIFICSWSKSYIIIHNVGKWIEGWFAFHYWRKPRYWSGVCETVDAAAAATEAHLRYVPQSWCCRGTLTSP